MTPAASSAACAAYSSFGYFKCSLLCSQGVHQLDFRLVCSDCIFCGFGCLGWGLLSSAAYAAYYITSATCVAYCVGCIGRVKSGLSYSAVIAASLVHLIVLLSGGTDCRASVLLIGSFSFSFSFLAAAAVPVAVPSAAVPSSAVSAAQKQLTVFGYTSAAYSSFDYRCSLLCSQGFSPVGMDLIATNHACGVRYTKCQPDFTSYCGCCCCSFCCCSSAVSRIYDL